MIPSAEHRKPTIQPNDETGKYRANGRINRILVDKSIGLARNVQFLRFAPQDRNCILDRLSPSHLRKLAMKTSIHIVKTGQDHVELQVDDEAAADIVADEAHKKSISPVIGQRRGREITRQHYVVLHGVVRDVMTFLEQNPKFEIIGTR